MTKFLLLLTTILLALNLSAQQTNFHFSHSDKTEAPPEEIWKIWTDVPNWKDWDTGLQSTELQDPFGVGAKGKLIPNKGPKTKFMITAVNPGVSYTFQTNVPFGKLLVHRYLEVQNGLTVFTHEVEFTGLLRKFWGRQLGENYRTMLPSVLANIKAIAEQDP